MDLNEPKTHLSHGQQNRVITILRLTCLTLISLVESHTPHMLESEKKQKQTNQPIYINTCHHLASFHPNNLVDFPSPLFEQSQTAC